MFRSRSALAFLAVLTLLQSRIPAAENSDPVREFLAGGTVSLDLRARYEGVEQTGLRDADAVTLRTRLGYTTGKFQGFSGRLEFEDTRALDGDAYNQAGLNPGGAGRAVVADPEGTELNQAWVAYTNEGTTLTLGRQRLVYDNARFLGDVGWRQRNQTFDSISLQNESLSGFVASYAYLNQINRVFGPDHSQGKWESDSHLLNLSTSRLPGGKLTGYAYLLDFKGDSPSNSSQTFGLSFAGSRDLEGLKLNYRLEYARQSDYGRQPVDYDTDYRLVELKGTFGRLTIGAAWEVLGSDRGVGFSTPLATLHAFNGWADLFLTTPGTGLRDLQASLSLQLPAGFSFTAVYHDFDFDAGGDLGREIDAQLSWKLPYNLSALLKYADFETATPSYPDTTKLWVQLGFTY